MEFVSRFYFLDSGRVKEGGYICFCEGFCHKCFSILCSCIHVFIVPTVSSLRRSLPACHILLFFVHVVFFHFISCIHVFLVPLGGPASYWFSCVYERFRRFSGATSTSMYQVLVSGTGATSGFALYARGHVFFLTCRERLVCLGTPPRMATQCFLRPR